MPLGGGCRLETFLIKLKNNQTNHQLACFPHRVTVPMPIRTPSRDVDRRALNQNKTQKLCDFAELGRKIVAAAPAPSRAQPKP
jgi:hypothetical protein